MLRALALSLAVAASSAAIPARAAEERTPPTDAPPQASDRRAAEERRDQPRRDEKKANEPRKDEQKPPERDDEEGDDNWLDVGHAFIEHRIFAPVLRIDRFFSDERDLEAERSRSFLRWRHELRVAEPFSSLGYTTSITASLKLPGLNKQLRRVRVEVVGETRDAFSALFPRDRGGPNEVPTPETNLGKAETGVGYRLWETVATHVDLGAGVLFQLPPGVYTRMRLRAVEPLGRSFLARQALTGFWRTDTLFGTTGSAEVERPLARSMLARLSGTTTIHQRSRGFEWAGDLSLLATLRERIGAQLGVSIAGASKALVDVDVYRVYFRLRRDLYRRWIFVELGPEYLWPWTPEQGRPGVFAVGLRLEFQFQGNEAPRAPEPDDGGGSEPKDPSPARSALPFSPAAG